MTFASSGLVNAVAVITGVTAAQAAINIISPVGLPTPVTLPIQNQYLIVGANSPASGSLAVPSQGCNSNPCGRLSDATPRDLLQLSNEVSVIAASAYRI